MIIVCSVLIIVFFAIQVFSFVSIFLLSPERVKEIRNYPKVSLLLAARNEEGLIIRSLTAIDNLDYPKDRIEVLIGNDASTDRTAELVRDFIQKKPHFKLFDIEKTLGKGRGKANVLAHLAHQASGEYYFITDVDVKLPSLWIRTLLQEFNENVGIVSGTTKCERGSFFASLQGIDWLHFMGYIKAFAHVGVGCTSVGNNMAVRAKAYWETGGYEEIDYSITEDYKLFEAVTKNGWKWSNVLSKESLGLAWYIPSIKEMLHQRKRWLMGAKDLPLNWKFMIILYGLFLPALVLLGFFDTEAALYVWFVKFIIQSLFIYLLSLKVERRPFSFAMMFIYEMYVLMNTFASAVFYFLPVKSIWKGRIYKV